MSNRRHAVPEHRGRQHHANALSEVSTMPSSRVTPHAAAQPQAAHHGTSVVRSGSFASEGGNVMFFSSVQKRGGVFTMSERDTYLQLQRKNVIPKESGTAGAAASVGKNAKLYASSSSAAEIRLKKHLEHAEAKRKRDEIASVSADLVGKKKSRFEVDSDSDSD